MRLKRLKFLVEKSVRRRWCRSGLIGLRCVSNRSGKPNHDRACQVFISKEPHAGLNASRVDYLTHRHHGSEVKQPSADVFAAEGRVILKEFLLCHCSSHLLEDVIDGQPSPLEDAWSIRNRLTQLYRVP